MVNRLNHCDNYLTTSGTSSCTEYLDHRCQRACNTTGCDCQCYFINDHTYTMLKKICCRIFKDYKRAQCRKKYTVFEGGNSVNVWIHRSGKQGDANVESSRRGHYSTSKSDTSNLDFNGSGTLAKSLQKDSSRYTKRKRNTDMDNNTDDNTHNRKNKQSLDKKFRKNADDIDQYNDEDETDRTKGKSKRGASKKGTLMHDEEEKDKEYKSKSGYEGKKSKQKTLMHDDEEKDKEYKSKSGYEGKKSKQKQGDTEDYVDGKTNAEKRGAKFGKDKKKTAVNDDDDYDGTSKTRFRRKSNRKSREAENDFKNRGSIRTSKGLGFIKDLRKKVRRGESLEMDYGNFSENGRSSWKARLSKTKKGYGIISQISKNLRNKKTKTSRADEIKTCDYLRALMEQRELDQLQCRTNVQRCIPINCKPQICNPCLYTCPEKSCWPDPTNSRQNCVLG